MVQPVTFGVFLDWSTIREEMPLHLVRDEPLKAGRIPLVASPPARASPSNYTLPIEVRLTTAWYASIRVRGYIYLTIKPAPQPHPRPPRGPYPQTSATCWESAS